MDAESSCTHRSNKSKGVKLALKMLFSLTQTPVCIASFC